MHCLLLVGNLSPADREEVPKLVARVSRDWLNYTADAWFLCTSKTTRTSWTPSSGTASWTVATTTIDRSAAGVAGITNGFGWMDSSPAVKFRLTNP